MTITLAPTSGPPPAVEDDVVRLAVVPPPDEDRFAGGANLFARAHVDEWQRAGVVDRGTEVDRQPGGPQRPPEADRLVQQPPAVDLRPKLLDHDSRRVGSRIGSTGRRRSRPARAVWIRLTWRDAHRGIHDYKSTPIICAVSALKAKVL